MDKRQENFITEKNSKVNSGKSLMYDSRGSFHKKFDPTTK